jgi:hypothetical protein
MGHFWRRAAPYHNRTRRCRHLRRLGGRLRRRSFRLELSYRPIMEPHDWTASFYLRRARLLRSLPRSSSGWLDMVLGCDDDSIRA